MPYPSPYILPADLLAAPTPVSWSRQGPTKSNPNQNNAEVMEICEIATTDVNNEVGQNLRATVDIEQIDGPSHRLGLLPSGVARFVTSMSPVLKVVQAQVAYGAQPVLSAGGVAAFNWQTIPAGLAYPEQQPFGIYGSGAPGGSTGGQNAILIAGGRVNWCNGRMGQRVAMTYVNGWPHASITETAAVGVTVLTVDDVSGWFNTAVPDPRTGLLGVGATGRIWDGPNTEIVQVTAVTPDVAPTLLFPEPAGPGTVTLAAPTRYAHTTPTSGYGPLLSALPGTVRDAAFLYAAAIGLRNGMAALSVPSIPGAVGGDKTGGVAGAITWLIKEAARKLRSFRRIY